MKKEKEIENVEETTTFEPGVSTAKLVIAEDGVHLVDDGVDKGICPIASDGIAYVLPVNSANRKWFTVKKADALREKGITEVELEYRETRKIGPVGSKLPNEKLISYLPEDLQAEYKAIIDRAIAARNDAKSKPMTELEKAQAKLAKAKAAYDKLIAETAE